MDVFCCLSVGQWVASHCMPPARGCLASYLTAAAAEMQRRCRCSHCSHARNRPSAGAPLLCTDKMSQARASHFGKLVLSPDNWRQFTAINGLRWVRLCKADQFWANLRAFSRLLDSIRRALVTGSLFRCMIMELEIIRSNKGGEKFCVNKYLYTKRISGLGEHSRTYRHFSHAK